MKKQSTFLEKMDRSQLVSVINPGSTIPELINRIRHSFRECEFDEVQNILMECDEKMKLEIEELVRNRDSLKKEIELLEKTQSFTELEKCSLQEKLEMSERRCEGLDKEIVQMGGNLRILKRDKLVEVQNLMEREVTTKLQIEELVRDLDSLKKENELLEKTQRYMELEKCKLQEKLGMSERKCQELDKEIDQMVGDLKILKHDKLDVEEKLDASYRKSEVIEKEIEELRLEKFDANRTIEELKEKEIEPDQSLQELQHKYVEACQTIDELRAQSFTELEKCSLEEKLGMSRRRCEELEKEIVQMGEKLRILKCDKLDVEEKLETNNRKCEKMEREIEDLRREKLDANEEENGNDNSAGRSPRDISWKTKTASLSPLAGEASPEHDLGDEIPLAHRKRKPEAQQGRNKKSCKFAPPPMAAKGKEKEKGAPVPAQITPASLGFDFKLTKPALQLSGPECLAVLRAIPTAADKLELSKIPMDDLLHDLAYSLMQALVRFTEMACRLENHGKVKESEKLLKVKDQELVSSTERLWVVEADLKVEKTLREKLEVKNKSLEAELERLRSNRDRELAELQAVHEAKEAAAKEEGRRDGLHRGFHHVFLTPVGQRFLQMMHEGLLAAYRRTPFFLDDLAPLFGYFIFEGGKKALEQVGALDRVAELDLKALIYSFEEHDPYRFMKIYETMPQDFKWWMPVMKAAVEVLVNSGTSDPQLPAWNEILYPVVPPVEGNVCQGSDLLEDFQKL